MRMNDYRYFSVEERLRYLRSQKMTTGIPYFGGKSKIGKYIYNTIFNMAINMEDEGNKPKVFVDAFCGGGKMALSVPPGWFDLIVMNDLDYGVYSYYCCAKDRHRELIATVDMLLDSMDERLFWVCIATREEKQMNSLMAGAMTYVAAALSFNNMLDKDSARYKPTMGENNEKTELEKVRNRAHKAIVRVHEKLNSQHYIIENLDYRELIKKYNEMENTFDNGTGLTFGSKNILWYFDPPYYEFCLNGTDAAPYANSFEEKDTLIMTDILVGKDLSYGELHYFIKSDYNPKETLKKARAELSSGKELSENQKKTYKSVVERAEMMQHIFDSIEESPFIAFSVGNFDKGAIVAGEVSVGDEWVWCKGLPTGYERLEKHY